MFVTIYGIVIDTSLCSLAFKTAYKDFAIFVSVVAPKIRVNIKFIILAS